MIAYRYRPYNIYTKEEIIEGYVYLAPYKNFNDKSECFSHIELIGTRDNWNIFLQYYLRIHSLILYTKEEYPSLGKAIENFICYQAVDKALKGLKKTKQYYLDTWCEFYPILKEQDPEWYKEYPNELSLEESNVMYRSFGSTTFN